MHEALLDALYVHPAAFQWVHFTPHGTVAGALSPASYGWHPHQPYLVNNEYTDWKRSHL